MKEQDLAVLAFFEWFLFGNLITQLDIWGFSDIRLHPKYFTVLHI